MDFIKKIKNNKNILFIGWFDINYLYQIKKIFPSSNYYYLHDFRENYHHFNNDSTKSMYEDFIEKTKNIISFQKIIHSKLFIKDFYKLINIKFDIIFFTVDINNIYFLLIILSFLSLKRHLIIYNSIKKDLKYIYKYIENEQFKIITDNIIQRIKYTEKYLFFDYIYQNLNIKLDFNNYKLNFKLQQSSKKDFKNIKDITNIKLIFNDLDNNNPFLFIKNNTILQHNFFLSSFPLFHKDYFKILRDYIYTYNFMSNHIINQYIKPNDTILLNSMITKITKNYYKNTKLFHLITNPLIDRQNFIFNQDNDYIDLFYSHFINQKIIDDLEKLNTTFDLIFLLKNYNKNNKSYMKQIILNLILCITFQNSNGISILFVSSYIDKSFIDFMAICNMFYKNVFLQNIFGNNYLILQYFDSNSIIKLNKLLILYESMKDDHFTLQLLDTTYSKSIYKNIYLFQQKCNLYHTKLNSLIHKYNSTQIFTNIIYNFIINAKNIIENDLI